MSDLAVLALRNLNLISFLNAIPDPRMRSWVCIPSWYLLQVAILGILSQCQSLRDLERFAAEKRKSPSAASSLLQRVDKKH